MQGFYFMGLAILEISSAFKERNLATKFIQIISNHTDLRLREGAGKNTSPISLNRPTKNMLKNYMLFRTKSFNYYANKTFYGLLRWK